MGQEATARIVQPLYFCLKAKFSHMVSDSRKSTTWIYQWPQTSQIHFTYMSIYLCIHVYIDRAIVLKERGQSKRAVAISGWPPTTTWSLPGVCGHQAIFADPTYIPFPALLYMLLVCSLA